MVYDLGVPDLNIRTPAVLLVLREKGVVIEEAVVGPPVWSGMMGQYPALNPYQWGMELSSKTISRLIRMYGHIRGVTKQAFLAADRDLDRQ